mmetsp:Transcript_20595/g.59053  ORF Transcript_20595/g.59053 Transcript_20595/m.59053 type:complete len:224 (-) Transcript_20595:302-973(-)
MLSLLELLLLRLSVRVELCTSLANTCRRLLSLTFLAAMLIAANSVMASVVCWAAMLAAACWASEVRRRASRARAFLAFSSRRLRSLAQDFWSMRKISRGTSESNAYSRLDIPSSSSSMTVLGLARMRALMRDLSAPFPWALASMRGVSPRLSGMPAAVGYMLIRGSTTSTEAPEAVAMCKGVRPVESISETREPQSPRRSVTMSRGGLDAYRMCRMSRDEFLA